MIEFYFTSIFFHTSKEAVVSLLQAESVLNALYSTDLHSAVQV